MRNKLRLFCIALISISIFIVSIEKTNAQKQYTYETVAGDPLKARIYTLENGLKVYMTVYKDAPRIQTYVAVRVGSKNDPHETTGLAHYFEHMMFKGTPNYGSKDWKNEAPLIAKIDSLFEIYRLLKDDAQRKEMYHLIDSISYIASTFAIPNEYDKLMSAIGADGTNAFTSLEQTVYVEDIPSNQIENWATIQAERFSNPVLRLFHTELETIYEEKNMTLTNDGRKIYTAVLEGLFPNHPYGTQTTIGTQEHIKNPSMKNIREFFAKYYVPNNMAICMSGDFDPDYAIKVIDAKFGGMKRSEVPAFTFTKEQPLTSPVVKEVFGTDAESITLAYRFPGAGSREADVLTMMDMILTNGTAGLIDLNLNQKQKVLSAGSGPEIMNDYSAFELNGKPKAGQTLDEVKNLLLSQVELLKKGEFPDWLLTATINDLKLRRIKEYESNGNRAMAFVNTFIENTPWKDQVESIDRLSKITKKEIVDFANNNLKDNYVVVYKRKGKDESIKKVKKPKITPIKINRDAESDFLKQIQANKPAEIQPVFADFKKDLQFFNIKSNIPVTYKENTENKTFDIFYVFEMGSNNDKKMGTAINYLKFLGTSKFTDDQLKEEFYKLGCSFNVSNSADQTYVSLSGLSENMEKALQLFESVIADCQPDKEALDNLIKDNLKKRADAKLNQQRVFSAMVAYGMYGKKSPSTNILSEAELKAITPEEMITKIKSLLSYNHHILYYGNQSIAEVTKILNAYHNVPAQLKAVPAETKFEMLETKKNIVYHVDFDSKQSTMLIVNKGGLYDKNLVADVRLYNEYFGGSMNSIVFQELRESRSLAYTAQSWYQSPARKDKSYAGLSYIATQNDKLIDALKALNELINNMPESEKAFKLAKDGIIQNLRTDRTTKSDILWQYENAKKLGLDYDIRRDIFEKIPGMTFANVKAFADKFIKNKNHTYLVLGDKKETDFKVLKDYGKVSSLTLEEIFGY
ncbi:MAG: insulinase family protein [Bacteroidetes bacterium]|nr:insulinase family protein [Bacteroidota bacterium]